MATKNNKNVVEETVIEETAEGVSAEENTVEIAVGSKEWYNELVPVNLFYDGIKYKDPVEVSVNGVTIKVPRGKEVMIKRKFALVIERSQKQDNYAAGLMARLESEAENAKDAL